MDTVKLSAVATMLAAALTAVGCCEPEKKQILDLKARVTDLEVQNNDLRTQVSAAKNKQADLMSQLTAKDVELAAAQARIDALGKQPPSPPPKPDGGAQDWEKGLVGDRVTVGSDILFASGQAKLTPAGEAAMAKIAADLKSKYPGLPVRVYGHTDTDPILKTKNLWQDNLDLSSNRAMAVTRYLIAKGIKASAIETIGMGEHHPAATKTASRRVEIVVIK